VSASGLYQGLVVHQRHHPKPHRLEYRVFSLLLDLDELDRLDAGLRLFSHNRFNLLSLWDRDHGEGDGGDLKQHVRRHLRQAGIEGADGAVRLLCYPRVLGYVFNPLSVFYCHDRQDRLRAVIYEVNNTHGERHSYVLAVDPGQTPVRHACDKVFFVSPFMPMDCRYRFHLNRPARRLHLFIRETHRERPILDAWFSGGRRDLSDRNLMLATLRVPLLTLKVVLGIHWEALKLWRKGFSVFKHPPTPKYGVTVSER
jgi:DUF1365 family protein